MKCLTVVGYIKKIWTPEVESKMAKIRDASIESNPKIAEWYNGRSLLQIFCDNVGGVTVIDSEIVQRPNGCVYEKDVFLVTEKKFYPSYVVDGVTYCRATLFENSESNLPLWTIHLSGGDDYSVALDIIGADVAHNEWNRLLAADAITDELVESYYFSN